MVKIGNWIARVIDHVKDDELPTERQERGKFLQAFKAKADSDPVLLGICDEVRETAVTFPLFQE